MFGDIIATPYDQGAAVAVFRRALRSGAALAGYRGNVQRLDADAINLIRDFTARIAKVYEDVFADLRALDFVPMADVPVQVTSTEFLAEFLSQVGEAGIVTEESTDLPTVALTGQTFGGKIAMIGAAGQWNQMDIARAAISMVNIPVKTQSAARRAIDTKIDTLVSLGDSAAGIKGFLRHPEIGTVPLPTGNWGAQAIEAILLDVHTWINTLFARVNYVLGSRPDTVIFPPSVKAVLSGKRSAVNPAVTAWTLVVQELRDYYNITVDEWYRCETASMTNGPRIVAYRRDSDKIGAVLPMPFMQFNPQERGMKVLVPSIATCGGTIVVEGNSAAYADNALS